MRWRSQFTRFAAGREGAAPIPGNPIFEEFLAFKRDTILKTIKPTETDPNLSKRAARGMVRRITNKFRERPRGRIPPRLLVFKPKSSTLIDTLVPDHAAIWLGPFERARMGASTDLDLINFSFHDDPEQTLDRIRRLFLAETGAWEVRVHFDDPMCLDIAPYLVLAMAWRDLAPVFSGGRITREIQRVLEAVQLRAPLGMGKFKMTGWDFYNVHAFPLHQRRASNTSTSATRHLDPQAREKVQDGLVRSINSWLDHPKLNMELTPSGRANIKNIVGELLDNAERHSMPATMDGDWTVAGFMARRGNPSEDNEYFQCSVAFVSIGASISQSLKTSPTAVAAEVEQYVEKHRKACDVDVLRTIMSVQDGITRVRESAENGRGGTGLQDVLELVADLGTPHILGCEPRVTIVSGNACVKLHSPYSLGYRAEGERFAPRQIWFNEANDSNLAPDAKFAFRMEQPFPGTLVTMSFVFTPEKIERDQ